MRYLAILFSVVVLMLGLSVQRSDAYVMIMDNWQLDPSVVDGSLSATNADIYAIGFTGTTFTDNHGVPVGPGVTFDDYGALQANAYQTYEGINFYNGLGSDYELTGVFVGSGINTTQVGSIQDFVFDPGGTLKIYLDFVLPLDFGDTTIGDGIAYGADNGTLVASLTMLVGDGTLDFSAPGGPDGRVDMIYEFDFMLPGFWLDEFGNDLSTTAMTVALTDSNNDIWIPTQAVIDEWADNWGNGTPTFIPGTTIPVDLYTRNDGSLHIGVPEPATLLLLGSGLIGLGFYRRKIKK